MKIWDSVYIYYFYLIVKDWLLLCQPFWQHCGLALPQTFCLATLMVIFALNSCEIITVARRTELVRKTESGGPNQWKTEGPNYWPKDRINRKPKDRIYVIWPLIYPLRYSYLTPNISIEAWSITRLPNWIFLSILPEQLPYSLHSQGGK